MKNITWSGRVILTPALVAAGSGLLATTLLADGRSLIAGSFDADGSVCQAPFETL